MVNHIDPHSFHLINPTILLHTAWGFGSLSAHFHTDEVVTCDKWLSVLRHVRILVRIEKVQHVEQKRLDEASVDVKFLRGFVILQGL